MKPSMSMVASRAWTWHCTDAPSGLVLESVEMAELEPTEALVRNAFIGLNPVDWKVLCDPNLDWNTSHVLGVDGAGTVIAVGEDLPEAWLGAKVCYHQSLRKAVSFAEYTSVDARALMRVPDGLDLAIAAGFPCAGLTAWLALDKLPVRRGAPLLVSGAGGAVGRYLVQLAVLRGYRVSAISNPRHWDRFASVGGGRSHRRAG